MSRRGVILLLIISLGLALRLYNLPQRGIIARDEAWYTYSARGLESRISQNQPPSSEAHQNQPDFELISSNNAAGKPAYIILLWSLGFLRGTWDYENVLAVSVIFGVLNIPATYWLARKMRITPFLSLIASLSAAFLFTNIYFSRIGYPHAVIIALHTLSIGLYLHADDKNPLSLSLLMSGVLWGMGLAIHMSLILALPGLLVAEIYQYKKHRIWDIKILLQRGFLWGGGILGVLLGWEAIYQAAPYIIGQGSGIVSITGSFLGDILDHAQTGSGNSNILSNFIFYGFALLGLENFINCLLFFIGIIHVWRERYSSQREKIGTLFFAANLLLLILYPALYGRQVAPLISTFPIFIAIGISVFIKKINSYSPHREKLIIITSIVFLYLFNLHWAYPLLTASSTGWVQAALWAQANTSSAEQVFASEISDAAILNYYLPGRVLWKDLGSGQIPAEADWYINAPTARFSSSWETISPLIADREPSAAFADPWLTLRPHFVFSGNWLLIPWWRWSPAPKSHVAGIDDTVHIYSIP